MNLALADLAQLQAGTPAAGAALQAALQDLAVRIGGQQTGPAMPPAPASELDPYIRTATALAHDLAAAYGNDLTADVVFWTEAIGRTADSHYRDMDHADGAMDQRLSALAQTARGIALGMEFGFLRNVERKLLSIGYLRRGWHARRQLLRPARLGSAAGQLCRHRQRRCPGARLVPPRPRHDAGRRRRGTLSWSGSMFEYLMPSLVMRAPTGSLLDQTNRLACAARSSSARARCPMGHVGVRL